MFAKLSVLALCLLHVSAWKIVATPEDVKAGGNVTITFAKSGNDPETVDIYFANDDETWKTPFKSWVSVWDAEQFWYTVPAGTTAGGYKFIATASGWDETCSNEIWVTKDW